MSTLARLTLPEYYRMIDAAVFDRERRIELIHGELREMSPIGDPHRDAVNALTEWAVDGTVAHRKKLIVQVQNPIRLPAQQSAPQPDMSWISRARASSAPSIGDAVFLVIEVAETTLDFDRGEKAELYAEAGIPDYWIVNLVDDCIEMLRDPRDGAYRSKSVFQSGQELRPLLFDDCPLQVNLLFA
ncbi:MAG: hypothetical protein B7Z73_09605 [Planctomycetia bacterium 21-64-5]|nr:MAG: hypothetical protein B7Z73_09605 [Planctomycetia bacterium 21-64-5]HQU42791.1 Uma2 family endonuclease [Pirellulales bacterium]